MNLESPRAAAAGLDFEPARLRAFLRTELPDLRGEMAVERIGGGQSNPTYFISFDNRRLVLRKRPADDLPKSAHDVGREYRLMRALHPTPVPVPEPILFHEAPDVVGTSFYLMGRVEGRIFHQSGMPGLEPDARRALYRAYAQGMAALHAVDWRAAGLESMARPGSFLARQVDRWSRAFESNDTEVTEIAAWLRVRQPSQERVALVHGDFKFNNLMFHAEWPELAAVLDWELATVGDPLTDVATGWAFLWETTPDEYGGIRGLDTHALGIPAAEDYLEDYYAAAGTPERLQPFHKVLALLRNAGIFRGIAERADAGVAAAVDAAEVGKLDRVYIRRALSIVRAEGT